MIDTVNQWGGVWLEYFGLALVQNTVFLGVVFLALHFARNARASTRYMIGITGLVKLLLPPFLPMHFVAEPGAQISTLSGVSYTALSGSAASGGQQVLATQQAPPVTPAGALFAVWLIVASGYLLLAAVSTLRLTILLRNAVPAGPEAAPTRSASALRIFISNSIAAPLILSLFPRRLFVPASWNTWPEECRRAALQHELAHARRHDGLLRVLEIVVQAVYFFHPLVWLLNRRTSAYREMACDDASIATNRIAPHEYSRQLLHIAESAAGSSSGFRAAAALFGSRSELLRRIRYQMKEGKMPQLTKRTGRLLIAALIVSILPLSWYCGEAKTGADQACNAHKAVANLPDGFDIIEVSVCRQRIEVDGKPTKLINLAAELEKKAEMPDSTIIVLKGDGKARMGLMHDIQVVLVDLGLVKVVYAGLSGEGLPLKLPVLKDADRLASLPEHNLAVIHLDGSGAVTLRGARIERENLRVRVEDELKENEFVVFSIQPAGDALFDDFLEVLAETKAGGASRIAVEKPI